MGCSTASKVTSVHDLKRTHTLLNPQIRLGEMSLGPRNNLTTRLNSWPSEPITIHNNDCLPRLVWPRD